MGKHDNKEDMEIKKSIGHIRITLPVCYTCSTQPDCTGTFLVGLAQKLHRDTSGGSMEGPSSGSKQMQHSSVAEADSQPARSSSS